MKNLYTFTAREYDSETGLYYYRARYYDPKAGRFITRDPIGFKDGVNQYLYVKNNPVNANDPMGLWENFDPFPSNPYNPRNWPWSEKPAKCFTCDDGLWQCLKKLPSPNTSMDCTACSLAMSQARDARSLAIIVATNPACIRCGGNLAASKGECFSKHCKVGTLDDCGNCK